METTKGSIQGVWRRRLSCAVVVGVGTLATPSAFAKDYYVATTGSDSAAGTLDAPFATLVKAVGVAVAGDTVFIRGGTYSITTPASSMGGVVFSKSGTSDTNRIKYWAYPGELPVFDFANLKISTTGYTMGFYVTGSWLHFKGLELRNVPMLTLSNNAISVESGANNIFELLNLHHLSGTGIFIGKGGGGHLVLNCDAHDNYDPTSSQGDGQNADGFGVHYQTTGARTIIRGCRAWWNSDDGYDLINHEVSVTVENSWAMGNGYANYGTTNPSSGNGNGFKMGSSKTGVRHLVQNNVAWKNKASGFYANHSSGGNTWYNNTSYSNGTQYNMLASPPDDPNTTITLTGELVHIMRNNLGFPNKNTNMTGVDTGFNSWDLGLTPAAKDFLSVTDPSMTGKDISVESSGALGPREADGSLPKVDFLKLIAGSQMIDKGTDVGLPFVGPAPDLGAYEFGGADGTTGAGGATGVGGATGGTRGSGGVTGLGGTVGSGGSVGSGGAGIAGTGGKVGTGGQTGNGGTVGTGGSVVAGSGGAAGGTTASGGVGVGGVMGSGGATTAASGTGGTLGSGGSSAGTTTQEPTTGGCSCYFGGARTPPFPAFALLALLWFARRRRRAR